MDLYEHIEATNNEIVSLRAENARLQGKLDAVRTEGNVLVNYMIAHPATLAEDPAWYKGLHYAGQSILDILKANAGH